MYTYVFVGLGALAMVLFLIFRDKKSSTLAICLKTLTSIFFIITALMATYENKSTSFSVISILMITGLVFGLFGDFTLDFKIYFNSLRGTYDKAEHDSNVMTYTGIGAFAVGHILYISATIMRYPNQAILLLYTALIGIALSLIIVIVGGKLTKLHYGKLKIPCIIYCALLTWFGALSLWIMLIDPSTTNILRFIGSVAFLVSDLFLSITYFSSPEKYQIKGPANPESRLMIILNHGIYYVAQFLIAISLLYL